MATALHQPERVLGNVARREALFELPLPDLRAGRGFSFRYAFINDSPHIIGSPTQNIGDENYWDVHSTTRPCGSTRPREPTPTTSGAIARC
jgi:hypothetical protein